MASLKTSSADLIVLVNHLSHGFNAVLASAVEGIDVMIGGHIHIDYLTNGRRVGKTLIAQAMPYGTSLGVITIEWDRRHRKVISSTARH